MTSASQPDGRIRPATIADFPWPFRGDSYHYSANVEPAPAPVVNASGSWGDRIIAVDDDFRDQIALRRHVIAQDSSRHAVLPNMREAAWEALDWMLARAALDHPDAMAYLRDGARRMWTNRMTGEQVSFDLGDESSLGAPPLVFITTQLIEDVALLDQREHDLFLDAGSVLFAANWSLDFDLGMSFLEVHGPLPRDYADGSMPRALQFLTRMDDSQAYRRTNWSCTIGHRLDLSIEKYAEWGVTKGAGLDLGRLGELFHLRVEVQHLIRLPRSQAILFLIHTCLAPLDAIERVPGWAHQLRSVLETVPDEMIAYKGLSRLRDPLIAHLAGAERNRSAPGEP